MASFTFFCINKKNYLSLQDSDVGRIFYYYSHLQNSFPNLQILAKRIILVQYFKGYVHFEGHKLIKELIIISTADENMYLVVTQNMIIYYILCMGTI